MGEAIKTKSDRAAYHAQYWKARREKSIEGRKGECCEVVNRVCGGCGKAECVKAPTRESELLWCRVCHIAHMRHIKVLGRKLPNKQKEVECKSCGARHISKSAGALCGTCVAVAKRAYAKKGRKARKKALGSEHRHRARKYGCYYEPVNRLLVYKRDGYRCVYCGVGVVVSKHYQENQATIDHSIPLCEQGPHSYTNVVTSCQRCNIKKGTKTVTWAHAPTKDTPPQGAIVFSKGFRLNTVATSLHK